MVKFRIVQGSSKKLGKFPSKYIVADFYEGLCRCRFSVSPVTGNAVSSMYASRESMVLSMVGHLFQNYDTRYVRFFPTYTCNHSCNTIYVRFFVTYTCILSCFVGFLFPSIWPFSYKRAYILRTKKPIYALQTSMWYMPSQKVVVQGAPNYTVSKNPLHVQWSWNVTSVWIKYGCNGRVHFEQDLVLIHCPLSSGGCRLPHNALLEGVECLLRDCVRYFTDADRNNDRFS